MAPKTRLLDRTMKNMSVSHAIATVIVLAPRRPGHDVRPGLQHDLQRGAGPAVARLEEGVLDGGPGPPVGARRPGRRGLRTHRGEQVLPPGRRAPQRRGVHCCRAIRGVQAAPLGDGDS